MSIDIYSDVVKQRIKKKDAYKDLWPEHYTNRETKKIYSPHNEDELFFVESYTPTRMLLKGGEGAGKGLTLSQEILTVKGYVMVKNISIGDKIFNEHGELTKVIAKSEIFHKDCYEIEFDTGETIVCDKDHLWTVEDYNYRKSLPRRGTKMPERTQAKYHLKTLDTETIFNTQRDCYRNRSNYSIPLSKPLRLPEKDFLIHPYVLGSWLGDGTSKSSILTIGNEDAKETISIYNSFGYYVKKLKSRFGYSIRDFDNNTITKNLKKLNIFGNKHIPIEYLRGSYQQRLELLQGLMDTDGYTAEDASCEFCSVKKELAEQVQELCFTLGIKATCNEGYVKYNGGKNIRYRVLFNPNIEVFRLKRKSDRLYKAKTQQVRKQRRYIVNVKKVESVPTQCIRVSNPSGLYLVTKNLIPTHNSVAGIVKTLNRLRDGMSGLMGSPTLPHFRRSLWKEFCRWCPPHVVIERHRHRLKQDWSPGGAFEIVFYNKYGGYSTLECGGFIENLMGSWEGPTVSFVFGDEMRHHKTAIALKTFDGRVRRTGPMQEPPQLYFTTTPKKHWLYEYFGPLQPNDKYADFKTNMFCGTIPVELNRENLAEGYIENRRQSLTASEERVLMNAEWEDIKEVLEFIDPVWWELCGVNEIPPYKGEAAIIAIDASKGSDISIPDAGALSLITRHPTQPEILLIRHTKIWSLLMGEEFNFDALTEEVVRLQNQFTVIHHAYDPYQLTYWAQTMRRKYPGLYREFNQMKERSMADSSLQARIMTRTIWHNNDPKLNEHMKNTNCKKDSIIAEDEGGYKIRIVKRHSGVKIDGAIATSMAAYVTDFYNAV